MGMGGGGILLIFLTAIYNFPRLAAQGINLFYFIPIGIVSLFLHSKNRLVEWKYVISLSLFGIIGSTVGVYLSGNIPSDLLSKVFGVFLVILGIKELVYKKGNTSQ